MHVGLTEYKTYPSKRTVEKYSSAEFNIKQVEELRDMCNEVLEFHAQDQWVKQRANVKELKDKALLAELA